MLPVSGILVIGYLKYNRMEMYDAYIGFTRISPSDATVKLSNRFAMNSLNITEYLIKQCPHYEKHPLVI